MTSIELAYSVILFSALFALNIWKKRRDQAAMRIKRGLNGFVTGSYQAMRVEGTGDLHDGDDVFAVQ